MPISTQLYNFVQHEGWAGLLSISINIINHQQQNTVVAIMYPEVLVVYKLFDLNRIIETQTVCYSVETVQIS